MTLLLNIDVPDVETGVSFHTAAFDLKVGRCFGAGFVELLGWPATAYLPAKQAGTVGAGGDPRRYDRHWTHAHPDIVVDDVDAAVDRAVGAGATLEAPASDTSYGKTAKIADPFGHDFCLLQFNERGDHALLAEADRVD